MMNNKILSAVFAVLSASAIAACGTADDKTTSGASDSGTSAGPGGGLGHLQAALTVPEDSKHDVALVQYSVVAADGSCSDEPIASTTSAIESESLRADLDGAREEGLRAFADGLLTLPPGDYKACVQPLKADGNPSEDCALAEGPASVFAGLTTEIVLYSQCNGVENGALDVIVGLNDPPIITDIDVLESKFITTCETATVEVTASDANGDVLSYSWEKVSGPEGGMLVGDGATATFTPAGVGTYEFRVTVIDAAGGSTSLVFPIHVSEADGECTSVECPEGTYDAAGYCWVRAGDFENGVTSCERFGLVGAVATVDGVEWTADMMEEVTAAVGCTNVGKTHCCAAGLFIDPATNECSTNGFTPEDNGFFENVLSLPQLPTIHLCQRPE